MKIGSHRHSIFFDILDRMLVMLAMFEEFFHGKQFPKNGSLTSKVIRNSLRLALDRAKVRGNYKQHNNDVILIKYPREYGFHFFFIFAFIFEHSDMKKHLICVNK